MQTINMISEVLVSCSMIICLVLWKFQHKALPDDLTVSVVCIQSSREAASKYSLQNTPYFHIHISVLKSATSFYVCCKLFKSVPLRNLK